MIRNALLVMVAMTMILPPALAIDPPDRVFEVDVSLVGCAVCRPKLKEVLMNVENVKGVEFDLVAKKAIVTMKGDKELKKETLEAAFKCTKYIFNGVTEKKAAESKPAEKPKIP